MPIFEYKCLKCNEIIEILVKQFDMVETPLHFSESCEAEQMERIISKTSFVLKGKGWYKDGYQKNNLQTEINDLKYNLNETKKDFANTAKNSK